MVMWLYSSQLDSDATSKQERQSLEKKIAQLQEDIHRLETSDKDVTKFEFGTGYQRQSPIQVIGNYVSPNMKATLDQVS